MLLVRRRRFFGPLLCAAFALSLASCTGSYQPVYGVRPVSTPTSAGSGDQEAVQFFNGFLTAENLSTGATALKGIKDVAVSISISDNLVVDTYLADCKNELVQKLRAAGLVVKEQGNAVICLNVIGMWDAQGATATFWIEINVSQWGHFVRDGSHYSVFTTCWHSGRLGHAGSLAFSGGFTSSVQGLESQLINDWVTANQ